MSQINFGIYRNIPYSIFFTTGMSRIFFRSIPNKLSYSRFSQTMYVPNKIWNILGYSMKNVIFQNLANLYVPNFEMKYSKNFNKKKYVPGARKLEPGKQFPETTVQKIACQDYKFSTNFVFDWNIDLFQGELLIFNYELMREMMQMALGMFGI